MITFEVTPKTLKTLNLFASKDQCRYTLCGVHVQVRKKDVVLAATDSKSLLTVKINRTGPNEETGEFIIPSSLILACPKPRIASYVDVSFDGKIVKLSGALSVEKNSVDGKYPNWKQVIPKTAPMPVTHINLKLGFLEKFVKAEAALNTFSQGVRVTYHEGAYIIRSSAEENFVGVLMGLHSETSSQLPEFVTE